MRRHPAPGGLAPAMALAVLLACQPALAARVAVVPFGGEADPALLREAEEATRGALTDRRDALATADEVSRAMRREGLAALTTTDQHLRLGRALRVEYVVAGRVTPLAGQYNLSITVYQVSDGRTEVLEEVVVIGGAQEAATHMLERLLRPGGLGEEPEPHVAPPEPPPEPAPPEPQPPQPAPPEPQEPQPPRPVRPQAPPAPLLSYTPDDPLALRGGLGLGVVLGETPADRGAAIALFGASFSYTVLYKFGLEVRAGLGAGFGTAGSISLLAGGGIAPPILRGVPLYVGGGVDLGLFLNVSGARAAAFQLRPAARVVYIIGQKVELGLEPLGFSFLFGEGGARTIYELRAFVGYRFNLR
ncbi:MAG: hypothetical protein HYY06_03940 [Deltaproteobacteria bacterium]|nr:hypothetical protein [Deltaproteobacteria bacterium]